MKRIIIGIIIVVIGIGAYFAYSTYSRIQANLPRLTEARQAADNAMVAKQNEDLFKPEATGDAQIEEKLEGAAGLPQLYWGDLHVHTAMSFDSYLFGNRISLDDAYLFARGKEIEMFSGEKIKLSRPLDFVGITDHAESFGLLSVCKAVGLNDAQKEFCEVFEKPTIQNFMMFREMGEKRPPESPEVLCPTEEYCIEIAKDAWAYVKARADAHYVPGEFTTFHAYEYSPPLPQRGKLHRNVFFKNSTSPDYAENVATALVTTDLWKSLEANCQLPCEYLTIPHNLNKTWGLIFADENIDGEAYTQEDWALRGRSEPLAEVFQVKGSSECGAMSNDEECGYELVAPICDGEQETGCTGPGDFIREGLKKGYELEAKYGFNPLRLGFVGSTDTHNSNPGNTEEWDYRGTSGLVDSPAERRLRVSPRTRNSAGGLAAVWASENTRDAIFEAMRRKETYATTGTRIGIRFFGAADFSERLDMEAANAIEKAYEIGVPMGSILGNNRYVAELSDAASLIETGDVAEGEIEIGGSVSVTAESEVAGSIEFLIWATRDPMSAGLHQVDMIKGWVDEDGRQEQIYNVYCGGELSSSGVCTAPRDSVDLADCSYDQSAGEAEVKLYWQDPEFEADQKAFYYVRVAERPTCRWTSYDALRLGVPLLEGVPATQQERAWSSPIWYEAEE